MLLETQSGAEQLDFSIVSRTTLDYLGFGDIADLDLLSDPTFELLIRAERIVKLAKEAGLHEVAQGALEQISTGSEPSSHL